MTEVLGPLAADYLSRIERRDRVGALRLARETADQDGPPRVIVEMLAPAQVEVGRRWEAAEWTVATEHEATAITETAVARLPDVGPADREGGVVVACVEQEWHSLPARMLGELMRFHGWDVVFLGASTPVADLNRFLGGSHPVAVALSCSVAAHLPGALRSIDAAHAAARSGRSPRPDADRLWPTFLVIAIFRDGGTLKRWWPGRREPT